MNVSIFLVLLAFATTYTTAQQVVDAECELSIYDDRLYVCLLTEFVLAQEDTLNIIANHEGDFTDGDVARLYFYNANVSYVPNVVFTKFPNLQSLTMNTVGLETIPTDAFVGATSLYLFSAMFNNIRSLPEGAFRGLNNIHEIDLGFNDISEVHQNAFEGLQSLEILDFNENLLTSETLEGKFTPLVNLRSLYLGGNRLGSLPAYFFALYNLRYLFIYNNQITSIHPNAFLGMPNLNSMLLLVNDVGHLNGSLFRHLVNLEVLDVTLMNLESVSMEDFDGLFNVRNLYINDNNLRTLPPNLFRHMVSLFIFLRQLFK